MEEKKENKRPKIVIGMDIAEDYLQMSYLYLDDTKPVTLRPGGVEEYNIPMCLSKRHEMSQWFFGKEALKHSGEGKGILIKDLFRMASRQENITVENREFSGEELFFLFVKKCYALLNFIIGTGEVVSLMITVEQLTDETVALLNRLKDKLPVDNDHIFLGDRQECLYYYVLNQPEELWHYQVAVFDFTSNNLKSYTFSRNLHTAPIVAMIERNDYESIKARKAFENEEEKASYGKKLDEQFLELLTEYVDGKLLSSVFFIGEGFFGGWYEKSLRFLCKSRRVFEGNNLYSKGACFGARERVLKSEIFAKHIFLGEEKLKMNLGMRVKEKGQVSYYPLLDGGQNWYEAKYTGEFFLKGEPKLHFLITSLEGGVQKEVPVYLKDFESFINKGVRFLLKVSMRSESEIDIYVEDKGFGEFRQPSGISVEQTITIEDGTVPDVGCNVSLCMGTYAREPYRFYKNDKGIWFIEELCYYICRNVHLLDRDIMTEELIHWIDEQCGMQSVAKKLREVMDFNGTLAAFASIILEDSYFKTAEDIRQISATLKENENLSIYERRKNRGDYLLMQKKYALAVIEYTRLCMDLEGRDKKLESLTLHNMACAYVKLFQFETAADCFLEAYEKNGDKEEIRCFLLCKRMELTKKDYIELTSANHLYYEEGLKLEKEMEEVEEAWQQSEEKKQIDIALLPKEDKNLYYEEIATQLEKWKEEYLDRC